MLSAATKASANLTKDLAENDVENAVSDGREFLDKVNTYASETGQKVRGAFDRAASGTTKFSHRVEDEIKANPVRSSALALGAGFILGALLTGRR